MKTLASVTLALVALFSVSAQAQMPSALERLGEFKTVDAKRIRILDAKVDFVKPKCPPNVMCPAVIFPETIVRLQVLHACMDHLVGDVNYSIDYAENGPHSAKRTVIYIAATEFQSQASERVRCFRAPFTNLTVRLKGQHRLGTFSVDNFANMPAPEAK